MRSCSNFFYISVLTLTSDLVMADPVAMNSTNMTTEANRFTLALYNVNSTIRPLVLISIHSWCSNLFNKRAVAAALLLKLQEKIFIQNAITQDVKNTSSHHLEVETESIILL